jgi:hypothetical protein
MRAEDERKMQAFKKTALGQQLERYISVALADVISFCQESNITVYEAAFEVAKDPDKFNFWITQLQEAESGVYYRDIIESYIQDMLDAVVAQDSSIMDAPEILTYPEDALSDLPFTQFRPAVTPEEQQLFDAILNDHEKHKEEVIKNRETMLSFLTEYSNDKITVPFSFALLSPSVQNIVIQEVTDYMVLRKIDFDHIHTEAEHHNHIVDRIWRGYGFTTHNDLLHNADQKILQLFIILANMSTHKLTITLPLATRTLINQAVTNMTKNDAGVSFFSLVDDCEQAAIRDAHDLSSQRYFIELMNYANGSTKQSSTLFISKLTDLLIEARLSTVSDLDTYIKKVAGAVLEASATVESIFAYANREKKLQP